MNNEVKEIMLEKLKEMAELDTDDFDTMAEYNGCCSVMDDIAQTLIDSQQKSDETALQKVCTPVTEYIKKHYDPYTTIIIQGDSIKIVQDTLFIPLKGVDENG